jgi:acetolactate synthase-1/2/3 large subunit
VLTEPRLAPSSTAHYVKEVAERARAAHRPGAMARPASGRETTWVEVPADEVGEALMQAWAVNGVDYLFFSSGSDIGWLQEAAVKLRALGRPTPRIITMLHENTNLHAACGYAMVAHRPAITAAHIELGTMNYGAAVHSAFHGRNPVMLTSGKSPNSYGGTARGDRDQAALWRGDFPDYGSIVRQFVKWDHDLRATDSPGLMISRGLQLTMTEPTGPTYLSIPRDVGMRPIQGDRFPTVAQLGIPDAPAGDADAIRQAADLLLRADQALVISQALGRDPRAFDLMVDLAELLGLPFMDANRDKANFPNDHPLYGTGPKLQEADLILVIEALVPWIPGYDEPAPEAKLIAIGIDPTFSRQLHNEFPADLRISGSVATILHQLYVEVDRLLTARDRQAIAERKERLTAAASARRARLEQTALSQQNKRPISPTYTSYALGQVLGDGDHLFLNDSVTSGTDLANYVLNTKPNSAFKSGSAAGGWGIGAALGAKLAAPDKLVVLAAGDGFFLYGVPYASLWAAAKYDAPFVSVVFQNLGYSTGVNRVAEKYPEGYSVREHDFEGGMIDPPPDLAKMAESVGCAGENVSEPEDLVPALERAVRTVRDGTPAVIAVRTTPLGSH